MSDKKGTIFNIQRFSINDGPGIRTTVFLKGCMLDCAWCHNPESKSNKRQLMFYESRCIGCGACVGACGRSLHSFDGEGRHSINREKCIACGACAEVCVGALEMCGTEKTVDEIIAEVRKDESFYKNSGGGLTVSGGEPFMQHEFALAILKAAKEQGIHTCIETCGYTKREIIEEFIPYVDIFLWDVKETDSARHKEFTGVNNEIILDNLRYINGRGASIVLRCPLIEGYNYREEHLRAIGRLAEELNGVMRVDVEPYHPLGQSKSEAMGKEYPLGDMPFLDGDMVKKAIDIISSETSKPVKKA